MAKVIVGLSGGVDSAVAAYILKTQGYQVIGVFMRNWDSMVNNDLLGNPHLQKPTCPEEQDWQDVVTIGKQLNIPVHRVNFVKQYYDLVFADLVAQYQAGRTPNPDILCNKYIKFGLFYDWVFNHFPDVDYIATGHYAALRNNQLVKPLDKSKDQTYFLDQVDQTRFSKTLFPLGNLQKTQVRKIAQKQKLIVAQKKDSTGICFIGERHFVQFLQNYIPAQPGKIIDLTTEQVVGTHVGAMYYTIGQRKGLNLGGMSEPYYVAGHNLKHKIIYVAPQSRPEFLISDQALVKDLNFLVSYELWPSKVQVKFRYKSLAISANITLTKEGLLVSYSQGFSAVTPGQQAVFYDRDLVLGGGVIDVLYYQKKKLKNLF